LDDDSQLLVPIFRGGKDDAERIRQLLYSDEDMRRTNSEVIAWTCCLFVQL